MKPIVSIKTKLFAIALVAISAVLFIGFYYALSAQTERLRSRLRHEGMKFSELFANTAGHVFGDIASARGMLDHIFIDIVRDSRMIKGVAVHSPDLGIVSSVTSPEFRFADMKWQQTGIAKVYESRAVVALKDEASGAHYRFVPIITNSSVDGVIVFAAFNDMKGFELYDIVRESVEHIYMSDVRKNMLYLKQIASEMSTIEGVKNVMIYDASGEVVTDPKARCPKSQCDAYVSEVLNTHKKLDVIINGRDYIFRPIVTEDGTASGVVEFAMDLATADRRVAALRRSMIAVGSVTLATMLGILWIVANRLIISPMHNLVEIADAVASGDHARRVEKSSRDEFGLLGESFNRMLDDIGKSRAELVSANVFMEQILSNMNEAVIVVNADSMISGANDSAYTLIGYSRDALYAKRFDELFEGVQSLAELVGSGASCRHADVSLRRSDGALVPVAMSCAPIAENEGSFVFVIQDITERKNIDEIRRSSQEKLSKAFQASPDWIVISRVDDGKVIEVNETMLRGTGFALEEVTAMTTIEIGFWPDAAARAEFIKSTSEGSVRDYEIMFQMRSGALRTMLLSSERITLKGVECFLTVCRDITERKQYENKLKAALREKEVLLREVHHRVKNNLQVIQSLLSMQAMYVEDSATEAAFHESQGRVRTMAMIHERFYRSDDLAEINFGEYAESLVQHILQLYGDAALRIKPRIDASDMRLSINSAIPCGIIVNECITNSLKYAFPRGATGEVFVEMHMLDDKKARLRVGDDGVGSPSGVDLSGHKTLGMSLVRILAEDQLEGRLDVSLEKGVVITIDFAVT